MALNWSRWEWPGHRSCTFRLRMGQNLWIRWQRFVPAVVERPEGSWCPRNVYNRCEWQLGQIGWRCSKCLDFHNSIFGKRWFWSCFDHHHCSPGLPRLGCQSHFDLSFGKAIPNRLEEQAYNQLCTDGIAVVTASGNTYGMDYNYSASYDNAISAASVDWSGS